MGVRRWSSRDSGHVCNVEGIATDFPNPPYPSHCIKINASVAGKRSNVGYTHTHKGLAAAALLTSSALALGDMKRPSCSLCGRIDAECVYPTTRKVNRGRRKSN